MNVLKLKEKREALENELSGLYESVASTDRSFTDEEQTKFDNLYKEIETLSKNIEDAEKYEKIRLKRDKKVSNPEREARQKYSISKAILERSNNMQLTGVEAEMHQEAVRHNPAIMGIGIPNFISDRTTLTSGTAATAGVLVATDLDNELIKSLQPDPVIGRLGAEVKAGLVGNLDLPRETAAPSATWEGEVDASAESNPTYDKLTLSPNRLSAFTTISKTLLAQNRFVADAEIATLIRQATARKLDATIINGDSGGTDPFDGILNLAGIGSVVMGTNGLAPTWADIVALESEVNIDNALMGNLHYLTTPGLMGSLKTTVKDAGSGLFVIENNQTNGYPVTTSTQVPSNLTKGSSSGICHAMIFGNFGDIVIGNWANGYDIIVDTFGTNASQAQMTIYVHSWWDVAYRHAQSFAAIKDALLA